jgi:asparagine synthase (glutamine-hydrolysing)
MSGLAGVWNLDGKPVDRADVAALASAIAHRGPDGCGIWVAGAAGLACQLLRVTPESATEHQPAIDSRAMVLTFDGRLDNRTELLALIAPAVVSADDPDSTIVLAAWRMWGNSFLSRLQGDFALALFDPRAQTLILARDAVGCRPLYYWANGRRFVFASEVKAILAHPEVPRKPNEDLLADFALLERLPYDDEAATFFQGIHAVRPGHAIRITPERISSESFWDFNPRMQVRYATYDDYTADLRERLIQAVKRRLRSRHPIAVSVSGGLDSSIVLCIADDLRRAGASAASLLPVSYTPQEDPTTEENRFIELLESTRSLHVHRLPAGEPGDTAQLTHAAWLSEWPRFDDEWFVQRPMLELARAHGARTILTGHWSDQILFVTGYLSDLFRRLAWRRVAAHLNEYASWFVDADPGYFTSRFRRELSLNLTPHSVRAALRPWHSAIARRRVDPLASHALASRLTRCRPRMNRPKSATAHARDLYQAIRGTSHRLQFEADAKLAASCSLESVTPFLDRDVISYLMSIPGDMQNRDGVPRALLRDAMRGIVPDAILRRRWRTEGLSAPAFRRDRMQAYLSTAMPLHASHALGLLSEAPPVDANSVAFIGLECWSRAFFSDTLTPPQLSFEGACESMNTPPAPSKDGDARLPYSAPKLTIHGDLRTITAAKGSNRDEAGQPKTFSGGMP